MAEMSEAERQQKSRTLYELETARQQPGRLLEFRDHIRAAASLLEEIVGLDPSSPIEHGTLLTYMREVHGLIERLTEDMTAAEERVHPEVLRGGVADPKPAPKRAKRKG